MITLVTQVLTLQVCACFTMGPFSSFEALCLHCQTNYINFLLLSYSNKVNLKPLDQEQ